MSLFMLIDRDTGDAFGTKNLDNPKLSTTKQRVYVPIVRNPDPAFDQETQRLIRNDRAEPLPYDPALTQWIIEATVKNKTAPEIDAELDAAAQTDLDERRLTKTLVEVIFEFENRIRALELAAGDATKTPVTKQQARDRLITVYKFV